VSSGSIVVVLVSDAGTHRMTAARQSSPALVLEEPRRLELTQLPIPETGDDDGVLRVAACGLCGTDHEAFTGELFPGYPFVPGHETIGTIERIGARAEERWGVRAGDRVAVEVFQSCRACARCAAGEYRRCVRHGLGDMYGMVPVDRAPGLWGGYAEYQYLAPDSMLLPVPPSLDATTATLFNPVGAGIRWAVTVPETQPGAVVAVLGPGIRGLSATAALARAGAGFVLVTGRGARDAPRLDLARRFGADAVVDVDESDPVATLREATGALADVVVDVTAKAPAALGQAVRLARPGGTVVVAGTRGTDATPGFSSDLVVYKELRLIGALGVDAVAYADAFELLDSGRFPFEALPRRTAGFADMSELLRDMAGEGETPPVHAVFTPH
jgi:alcohol dehydrogenase